MKMTIDENQRGFLFHNGRFVRMLEPGGHFAPSFLGYKVVVEPVDDKPFGDESLLAAYGRDEKFLKSTTRVEIADGQKALHCVDGRFAEILPRGVCVYWNIFKRHSFIILNTSDEDPARDIPESVLKSISDPYCVRLIEKEEPYERRRSSTVP
jgi:hypothetical protein